MSFGSPCGGAVDVGDGGLGVGDHRLDAVGEPGGASSSVIWRTEASEALTLSTAPPVRRSLTTPRRSVSDASTEAGRLVTPSLLTKASMPSTRLVAEATSSSSGQRVRLGGERLDLVEERGHAVGGGADAGERGLGGGEDGVEVGDELLLGRLVDQRAGRGEDGGELGGGLLDALLAHELAGVGEQEAEVLRRLADALGGDEGVDVGEERDGAVHHVLERQLGDALQHALGGGGDAGDVGGGARQQRVGLGVAVERRPGRRRAPWRGRRRGSGSAGRVAASWARRPCSTWLARRSSAGVGGVARCPCR